MNTKIVRKRDLIRNSLLRHTWQENEQIVAGSILLFYDHHKHNLMDELTKTQHEMHDHIMAQEFHMAGLQLLR